METKKKKSKISKLKYNFIQLFRNLSINNKETDTKDKALSGIKTETENSNHEKKYTSNLVTTNTEREGRLWSNVCAKSFLKNDEVNKESSQIFLKSEDTECPNINVKVEDIRELKVEPGTVPVTTDKKIHPSQSDSKKSSDLIGNRSFKLEPIDDKSGIDDNFTSHKFYEDYSEDESSESESNDEYLFANLEERGPKRNQRDSAAVRHVEYLVPLRQQEISSRKNFHQIPNETILQILTPPEEEIVPRENFHQITNETIVQNLTEEEFFGRLQGTEIEKVIVDIEIEKRIADIKRKEELERQKRLVDLEIENRIAKIQAMKESENCFAVENNFSQGLTGFNDLSNEREKNDSLMNSIQKLDYSILSASNLNHQEDLSLSQLTQLDCSNDSLASSMNNEQISNEIMALNSKKDNNILMQADSFCMSTYNDICKEYEERILAAKEEYEVQLREEARLKKGNKVEEENKAIYFLKKEGRKKYKRTNLHKAVMDLNLEETCAIVETHKKYYNNLSFTINLRDNKGRSILDRAEETNAKIANKSLLVAYLKDNFAINSIHHMLPIIQHGT